VRAGLTATPSNLLRQAPASADAVRAYALQLGAAAADFEIDEWEVEELSELVAELALTPAQVRAAHTAHVEALLEDRLRDGLLTWAEQQEVRAFARLLGVGNREVEALLTAAAAQATVEGQPTRAGADAPGTGISVCFTGEFVALPLTREEVSELAEQAGMQVLPRVTKKLDVLVCLDPEAGTSKLAKAAEYGTIVIDQDTFLALAGAAPARAGVVSSVLERLEARRAQEASAAERKAAAAAERARERNRVRARSRREGESAELQTLWCLAGRHEWQRPPRRGRPPRACPDHVADPGEPAATAGGNVVSG
jgi:hypothetical protein